MTQVATLKSDAPDTVLREALRTSQGLVHAVQMEVALLHEAIMKHHFAPLLGMADCYSRLLNQLGQSKPNPNPALPAERKTADALALRQLRLVLDARELLRPVLEDLGHLSGMEVLNICRCGDSPALIAKNVRAVMSAHPGLAAFQKRLDAERERIAAAQEADRQRQCEDVRIRRQRERSAAACELVQRLARGGVTLIAGGQGLEARPAGMLAAADRAAISELKAELTDLLCQPAELVA